MEKMRIEEVCDKVLKQFDYNGGEVDIIALAKMLGFTIGMSPLPESEDGFIIVDKKQDSINKIFNINSDKIICVNSERTLKEKKFILAHELGHYLLHYQGTQYEERGYFAHRENIKGKNDDENDVDYFAACLLMPSKYFKDKFVMLRKKYSIGDCIILLSEYFNTPLQSVLRRIDEVITENELKACNSEG